MIIINCKIIVSGTAQILLRYCLIEKSKKNANKNNITQHELANILEVSRARISNIESGRRGMNLEQLNVLGKYFKIDLSYFVNEDIIDDGEKLLEKANAIFNSNDLTNDAKENIFTSILNIIYEF